MFQLKQEWSLEFLDGTPEFPQEDYYKSRGTMRSPQQSKELHVPQMNSPLELIPWLRLKRNANVPQGPQEEDSLSYRYVSGTQSLLLNREWTMRCTDSKEGRITLQWLECWLVFLLTRNVNLNI